MWLSEQSLLDRVARVEANAHLVDNERLVEARSRMQARRETPFAVVDGEARIPVEGVLLAEPNALYEAFGIPHTAYPDVRDQLAEANARDDVKTISLQVFANSVTILVRISGQSYYSYNSISLENFFDLTSAQLTSSSI